MKPVLPVGTVISYLGVNAVVVEDGPTEFLVLCDGGYETWSWELDDHTCVIESYPSGAGGEHKEDCSQQVAPNVKLKPDDLIIQHWSSKPQAQWDSSQARGIKITHVPSRITVTCETEGSVYANKEKALRILEARLTGWSTPDITQLVDALEGVVSEIEKVTCLHENTHRGGVLWEICEDCGAKWADDRGGKPEFSWPDSVEKARTLIAAHRKGGGK